MGSQNVTGSEYGSNINDTQLQYSLTVNENNLVTAMFKSGVGFSAVARTTVVVEDAPKFNYTCPPAVDSSMPFHCTLNQDVGTTAQLNTVWTHTSGLTENITYTTPGLTIFNVIKSHFELYITKKIV
jgi:hypothetical protein